MRTHWKHFSYLNDSMQESHSIERGLPLRHICHIQLVLSDPSVSSLQSWLHALWWLVCEFDRGL